ncbi:putative BsuMI modification methylase subunit YdiO [bacterium HR40]|nr:putative BsuMI modification methylase subunit YdiO [bacterium HR40]
MIRESYESRAHAVRRTLFVEGKAFHSRIEDVSGLGGRHSSWARWWRSYLFGKRTELEAPAAGNVAIADVFCGCGGLTLGAIEACLAVGIRPTVRLAIDMDTEALAVYARNLGPERTLGANVSGLVDYKVLGWGARARFAYDPEPLHGTMRAAQGEVDLLLAGPPCEGHSNLNNRTRRDDPRNLLYLDAVATAVAIGAKTIVLENVPDIVNDRIGVLGTAVALLEHAGYSTTRGVLAADGLGWPQTRKRFFVVGSRVGAVDLKRVASALARDPATVRWAIEDLVDNESDQLMDSVPALSAENRRRIDYLFDNDLYELPDDIRPRCHRDGHTYPSVYGRLYWDRPAGTITSGFVTPGRGRFIHPSLRRPLTPREAARLQGFPDWFDFHPSPGRPPKKSALVKWIGDAVPPILGYAVTLAALAALLRGAQPWFANRNALQPRPPNAPAS